MRRDIPPFSVIPSWNHRRHYHQRMANDRVLWSCKPRNCVQLGTGIIKSVCSLERDPFHHHHHHIIVINGVIVFFFNPLAKCAISLLLPSWRSLCLSCSEKEGKASFAKGLGWLVVDCLLLLEKGFLQPLTIYRRMVMMHFISTESPFTTPFAIIMSSPTQEVCIFLPGCHSPLT